MVIIIYAHPLQEGICASIRNAVTEHLRDIPYKVLDLYKDGFNPALTADERANFFNPKFETGDPLVKQYQTALKDTDHLVFIFPIWWFEQPAILKGFFERVCLPGFAYAYSQTGPVPLLNNIVKVTVLTASGDSTESLKDNCGDIIEKNFIGNIVHNITHTKDTKWLNLGHASQSELNAHIDEIKKRI
jgi:putative NADPH-quinone reductase